MQGRGCRGLMAGGVLWGAVVGTALAQTAPGPAAPSAPVPAVTSDFKTADELLAALETSNQDLVSLTADVKYDKTFEIQGDRQVRIGKVFYVVPISLTGAAPRKKFAIRFDEMWVGGVKRPDGREYIFDGEWLLEKDPAEKDFNKRQVVPPGEHFDPLKIGEGPFVVPIGQRRADIEQRYTTELLPALAGLETPAAATEEERKAAEAVRKDVEGSWQLKLLPRAQFAEQEDLVEIRLWYKRGAKGDLLPRMARTVNKAGDVSVVLLINTELQLAGQPENRAAIVPPQAVDTTPPAGWNGRIEPFRKAAGGEGKREGPDAGEE